MVISYAINPWQAHDFAEDKPTPTIAPTQKAVATPTKQPEPTSALPSAEGLGVGSSCWNNDTPGAICKEETTGMEFVYVSGGEFWMGKYEVTQAQWEAVMGNTPSNFKGADRPVEQVSWNDAQTFIKELNAAVETPRRGVSTFRLPSEAEWEYAARAGTQTAYSFGDDPAQLDKYAWYSGNSGSQTHPVGQKHPNAFGLYDMHGNVWEWCADTWPANYNGAPDDGSIWGDLGDKKAKLLRGGSWVNEPSSIRTANRNGREPVDRYDFILTGYSRASLTGRTDKLS